MKFDDLDQENARGLNLVAMNKKNHDDSGDMESLTRMVFSELENTDDDNELFGEARLKLSQRLAALRTQSKTKLEKAFKKIGRDTSDIEERVNKAIPAYRERGSSGIDEVIAMLMLD